ncbi:hypothetical protein SEPCBS57363_003348 [Sporothrix epigloea]|uniref:Uncharacterized protein n=1 Tax=Sporothrix epigloea TaxID=1892477 RepID=A0ABP0DKZ9_9PEZI
MSIDAIMQSDPPKSPTLSTRSSRNHDTGFPVSFCGRGNTTWRHPDADTSPNACISSNDIAVDRLYSRSRRSFLHNKNKRTTVGYGKLTQADLEAHGELASIVEIPSRANVSTSSSFSSQNSQSSADGGESLNRPFSTRVVRGDSASGINNNKGANEATNSIHSDIRKPDASHSVSNHSGVLRKLRLHN